MSKPTQWYFDVPPHYPESARIHNSEGKVVAADVTPENAQRIVTAVNAHDERVEALEEMGAEFFELGRTDWFPDWAPAPDESRTRRGNLLAKARALLGQGEAMTDAEKKEHPDAKLRRMVDAVCEHAHQHGIRFLVRLRWPNGMTFEHRSLSPKEKVKP